MKPLHSYSFLHKAILVAMLGAVSGVHATTNIIEDTLIDGRSPVNESYTVNKGAKLEANGATTGSVTVYDGALIMDAGAIANGMVYFHRNTTGIIKDSVINNKLITRGGEVDISNTIVNGIIEASSEGGANGIVRAKNIQAHQFSALYGGQLVITEGFFDNTKDNHEGYGNLLSGSHGTFISSAIIGKDSGVAFDGKLNSTLTLINSSVWSTEGPTFKIYSGDGSQNIRLKDGSTAGSDTGVLLLSSSSGKVSLSLEASHAKGDILANGTGDVNVSLTEGSTLSGKLVNVNRLALDNTSLYEMTANSDIKTLALEGGTIVFSKPTNGEFHTLVLGTLAGNGHFFMNIADSQSDLLDITGNASGNYLLHVATSGTEIIRDDILTLVRTGGGDAEFALNGGRVDMGAWQQELVRNGNQWELVQAKGATSASTDAMLAMASAPQFMHQGELNALRSRLAVKDSDNAAGVWGTMLYNRSDIEGAQGSAYRLTQNGMMLGGDKVTDTRAGELTTGAYLSQSTGNIKHARGGDSKVTGYGGGVYARLSAENGAYASTSAQIGHFSNKLNARMSDGGTARADWNSLGYGLMVETGRQITVGETTSLTPFVGVNAWLTPSENVTLSNGMTAETGDNRSLLAEAGVRMSTRLDVAEMAVTPYVTLAVQQELVKSGSTQINDAYDLTNDFTGTGGTIAGGISVAIAPTASVWLEAEYGKSEQTESALAGNVGFRVAF